MADQPKLHLLKVNLEHPDEGLVALFESLKGRKATREEVAELTALEE